MAQITQPDYVEGNLTPIQNTTRLAGQVIIVGGISPGSQFNQNENYSRGVFIGVDGHNN